ncbi:hypothetical protein ITJ58_01245 [Curtobacterium flaccumfaciens]|uniref:hypothetical protein n=1 Tax=Curtobacterium flaccumfaciens TaxID=2035 RepID=UPI00188C9D87|nr:hypothetical protein [Curtobacterium flaccumfaciens]MBF4592373.1 hypothetical protein [Curtobacterium flaccumfaciens]
MKLLRHLFAAPTGGGQATAAVVDLSAPGSSEAPFWEAIRDRTVTRWRKIWKEIGWNGSAGFVAVAAGVAIAKLGANGSPAWVLPAFSPASVLAIGGGLVTAVTGLWIAVALQRDPVPTDADYPAAMQSVLVRRRIVLAGARALIAISVGLACLSAYWFSGLPNRVDLGRMAGVLIAAAFLAVAAADAAVLSEAPEGTDLAKFRHHSEVAATAQTLQHLIGTSSDPQVPAKNLLWVPPRRWVASVTFSSFVVAAIAAVMVPATYLLDDSAGLASRLLCCFIIAAVAWGLWLRLGFLVSGRRFAEAVGVMVLVCLVGIATLGSTLFPQEVADGAKTFTGLGLTTTAGSARAAVGRALLLGVPAAALSFGVLPNRRRSDRPVRMTTRRIIITSAYLRRYHRLQAISPEKLPWDGVVVAAAVLVLVLPPAAIMLAHLGTSRILRTQARGHQLAGWIILLGWVLLSAPFIAVAVLAVRV